MLGMVTAPRVWTIVDKCTAIAQKHVTCTAWNEGMRIAAGRERVGHDYDWQ